MAALVRDQYLPSRFRSRASCSEIDGKSHSSPSRNETPPDAGGKSHSRALDCLLGFRRFTRDKRVMRIRGGGIDMRMIRVIPGIKSTSTGLVSGRPDQRSFFRDAPRSPKQSHGMMVAISSSLFCGREYHYIRIPRRALIRSSIGGCVENILAMKFPARAPNGFEI